MMGVKFCDGCEIIATDEGDAGGYASQQLLQITRNSVNPLSSGKINNLEVLKLCLKT
jgi:hypothetical protein